MIYYNEIDPKAVAWLRELMAEGLIPKGEIDERSIADVRPGDLRGFRQCHFFAGIGGWSLALQLAGWSEDREVWSGSCPCQPLSSAGQRKGHADERHLWPAFYELISQRQPATVFGEQVAGKDGREWLAGVRADLEGTGYAFGASDLCAAGAGAPHIRQRLYWVAQSLRGGFDPRGGTKPAAQKRQGGDCESQQRSGISGLADSKGGRGTAFGENNKQRISKAPCSGSSESGVANSTERGQRTDGSAPRQTGHAEQRGEAGGVGNAQKLGHQGGAVRTNGAPAHGVEKTGFWSDSQWHLWRDGKLRRIPTQSVFQRVVDGLPHDMVLGGAENAFPLCRKIEGRAALLKGYGNAIVPELAAQFIQAFLEATA